jgi:DNA-binding transcriptional ArsR family regulator
MADMTSPPASPTVKLFRGLADPSRLAVLQALRDGPLCVSEVVRLTGLSQPNASEHLACLHDCGLAVRERRGKFVYYGVADKRVIRLLEEAEAILEAVAPGVLAGPRYGASEPPRRRRVRGARA